MKRIIALLCLLLLPCAAFAKCSPTAASRTTSRLSMPAPSPNQCNWHVPDAAFKDAVDTRMCAIDYANTFTANQTFDNANLIFSDGGGNTVTLTEGGSTLTMTSSAGPEFRINAFGQAWTSSYSSGAAASFLMQNLNGGTGGDIQIFMQSSGGDAQTHYRNTGATYQFTQGYHHTTHHFRLCNGSVLDSNCYLDFPIIPASVSSGPGTDADDSIVQSLDGGTTTAASQPGGHASDLYILGGTGGTSGTSADGGRGGALWISGGTGGTGAANDGNGGDVNIGSGPGNVWGSVEISADVGPATTSYDSFVTLTGQLRYHTTSEVVDNAEQLNDPDTILKLTPGAACDATPANCVFTIVNPGQVGLVKILLFDESGTDRFRLADSGNTDLASNWEPDVRYETITLLGVTTTQWVEIARSNL